MKSHGKNISEIKWSPAGFHFLGPEDALQRRKLLDKIYWFFKEKGYVEVIPPGFDFSSSFSHYVSLSEQGKILKTRDLAGSEISPSIDLTIQVVKGMAGFAMKQGIQRIFYTGKVVKDNFKSSGERREFTQAGAEILGHSNGNAFKMLLSQVDSLHKLLEVSGKWTIVLGNTSVFSMITEYLKLNKQNKEILSRLLYSKDIFNLEQFLDEYVSKKDIKYFLKKIILSMEEDELNKELLNISAKYKLKLEDCINESNGILQYSNKNLDSLDVCLDYSLIRDMDYYTGFVFHGYAEGLANPVIMGGAYDHLFEEFSGVSKRACGYAINIDMLEELV